LLRCAYPATYQGRLSSQGSKYDSALDKINFDISGISSEGLVGPPDGLRAISYEFCIPANDRALAEVQAIEPNIEYYSRIRGRIGCRNDQYLCIGNTHNPRWKEILLSIARLEYVEKINQFYGE
jgi:hypothetical protein